MRVKEAMIKLHKLDKAGHGERELIAVDTRSGVSSNVSIGTPAKVDRYDREAGTLCDWELGVGYVPVYLDH